MGCYHPLKWEQNGTKRSTIKNLNDQQKPSISFYKIKSRNTYNKITSTFDKLCEMKAIIGKKLASLTILQNKTQCVGFFTQTCKMKHSMDKAILF